MVMKPGLINFNGGEVSPKLEGRVDWAKYSSSARVCRNFIPLVEGGLKRRSGSHFVALAKGVVKAAFKFVVATGAEGDVPALSVGGKTAELAKREGEAVWETDLMTYLEGETVVYTASCNGYVTKTGAIAVAAGQEDVNIVLAKPSENDVTIKIVVFADDVAVRLNDVERREFTGKNGDAVTWIISYGGASASGSIILTENRTYFAFMKNEEVCLSADEIVLTTAPTSGTLYLPDCKIRIVGVGGGGGAYEMAVVADLYYSGGSGAGIDAVLSISAGSYAYGCGKLGINIDPNIALTSEPGGATYLKKGGDIVVQAGGGGAGHIVNGDWWYGGDGGSYVLADDFLHKLNWAKNGNACTAGRVNNEGSYLAGVSVYNGYGWGTGYRGTDADFSYEAGTQGFLSISFAGE